MELEMCFKAQTETSLLQTAVDELHTLESIYPILILIRFYSSDLPRAIQAKSFSRKTILCRTHSISELREWGLNSGARKQRLAVPSCHGI